MKISKVLNPDSSRRGRITDELWKHNGKFHPVEIEQFNLEILDEDGALQAGLIAQTWWGALEIQYLWVSEQMRGKGCGKQLVLEAEAIALERNCHMAYVDTFDFQARGFYQKLNYKEYGSLNGYAKKFERHYLSKALT